MWFSLFKRNLHCQSAIKDHTKTDSNNSNDQKTIGQEVPLTKAAKKICAVPFDEVSSSIVPPLGAPPLIGPFL